MPHAASLSGAPTFLPPCRARPAGISAGNDIDMRMWYSGGDSPNTIGRDYLQRGIVAMRERVAVRAPRRRCGACEGALG